MKVHTKFEKKAATPNDQKAHDESRGATVFILLLFCWCLVAASVRAQQSDSVDALIAESNRLSQAGKYHEAIGVAQRAVALGEKSLGPNHPAVAHGLNNLALLYHSQGHYTEAEPLLERALTIYKQALGPDHPEVATIMYNLAFARLLLGRYAEAEPLFKRAQAIYEQKLDHAGVARTLNYLGDLYTKQGRYADAEPLLKRALTLSEEVSGPDSLEVSWRLSYLGEHYTYRHRYADAEPLFKRELTIREQALPPNHPDLATAIYDLAVLYSSQGRYDDAEPLFERALTIREQALGPNDVNVAESLFALADLYESQRRYANAELRGKRALAIYQRKYGSNHPYVATTLDLLAGLYKRQGRYSEAEALFKRSVAIRKTALGPDHPNLALSLGNLGEIAFAQSDWPRAADYMRRSAAMLQRWARLGAANEELPEWPWQDLLKATYRLSLPKDTARASRDREMFDSAQRTHISEATVSLIQMSARYAKGDTALARLVRERQDLAVERGVNDKVLIAAVSQKPAERDTQREQDLRTRQGTIDGLIDDIDDKLAKEFPEYANFTRPQPLSVVEVQKKWLHADEALILIVSTDELKPAPQETFLWVITSTDARLVHSDLGTKALAERVFALRCGLDEAVWSVPKEADRCRDLLQAEPAMPRGLAALFGRRVLPFDLTRAHELYKALFGPVEDMIAQKHLLIVPGGPLMSLPFHVLVTEASETAIPRNAAEYRKVAWLGLRQPITVLPSVSSLKALRQYPRAIYAIKPYLGIGNPLLTGAKNHSDEKRAKLAREKQHCPKDVAIEKFSDTHIVASAPGRGTRADVEAVREWPPLPETADELCAVARELGAAEKDVLLGADSTKTKLKELSKPSGVAPTTRLSDYRIIHFATHGAFAGEIRGSAEPGLILTPPIDTAQETEGDDGYLTASEVTTLQLNADLVILSACNTASGTERDSEPLSGLARAFFYAGARAVLVSHWKVDSEAAVRLIIETITKAQADHSIGRAEALRLAMRDMLRNGNEFDAHPSIWAPFVVVGEGSAN